MSQLHQLCTEVPVTQLPELLMRFGTYNSPGRRIYIQGLWHFLKIHEYHVPIQLFRTLTLS